MIGDFALKSKLAPPCISENWSRLGNLEDSSSEAKGGDFASSAAKGSPDVPRKGEGLGLLMGVWEVA